jgi:signal transduction histidine kinase
LVVATTIATGTVLTYLRIEVTRPIDVAPWWLLWPPLLIVGLAGLWRRKAPAVSALVGAGGLALDLAATGGSLGTLIVFANVLYDSARFGRRELGRCLLAGTLIGTLIVAVTVGAIASDQALAAVAYSALTLVLPVLIGQERQRREATISERTREARDLHDAVANRLSAIAMYASGVEAVTGTSADPRVRDAIHVIRDTSVQGITEMRTFLDSLRDPHDDDMTVRDSSR